jgi:hypothetical protein
LPETWRDGAVSSGTMLAALDDPHYHRVYDYVPTGREWRGAGGDSDGVSAGMSGALSRPDEDGDDWCGLFDDAGFAVE